MNTFKVIMAFIIGISLYGGASKASAQDLTTDDNVIVKDTGSTNFSGYQIVIAPSGQVNVKDDSDRRYSVYTNGQYNVSADLVKQLVDDLNAVMPLSQLSMVMCAKSRSFGTRTFVTYKGQTSPDIQCVKDEKFISDINTIIGKIPKASQ